jgi:hypothetical protein
MPPTLFDRYRICPVCGHYIREDVEAHVKSQKHLEAVALLDKLGAALREILEITAKNAKENKGDQSQ